MKKKMTLKVEDNLLTMAVTFPTHEEANTLYDNLVAIFTAGENVEIELSNPEPSQ